MPTQVQFRRGTSTQNDAFLGANGEIAVDLTNKVLRVHDGVTTGGWKMSNTDSPIFTTNVVIGNVTSLPNSITVGNSSVNAVINSTSVTVANLIATNNLTISGNSYLKQVNTSTISTGNLTVSGSMTVSGNLIVSGNLVTVNVENLSVKDNMIYLNQGGTTSNPDVGIAANYNDGSYAHTGVFRDATDGTWKVFDSYTPEPDANVYIDTTNTSFHLANFQANTLYLGNTSTNWLIANTSGMYHTGTINAVSYSIGTVFTTNSTLTNTVSLVVSTNTSTFGTAAYVVSNGNIGLANSAPAHKLAINGTMWIAANITTTNTVNIIANGVLGTAGQVLASNGTTLYWQTLGGASAVGGSNTQVQFNTNAGLDANANFTWVNPTRTLWSNGYVNVQNSISVGAGVTPTTGNTTYVLVANGATYYNGNVVIASGGISANGGYGTAGQALLSNGSAVYWATATAGSNTYIQFNDSSSAGATADFTYNKTNKWLYVANAVGIGVSSPAAALHVSGSIYATGDVVSAYSDERLKDITGPIPNALDKVNELTGFYYTPNKTALNIGVETNQLSKVGVSAQQVRKVLPEAVKDAPIGQGYLTVQYEKIVPLLIEAIKELREEIRVLKETK